MKAVGNNIIVKPKPVSNKKTEGGLVLSVKDREDIRYTEANVVSVSDQIEVIKQDDSIYYDRHSGHKIEINNEQYTVIKLQDVVVLLWE